MSSDQTSQSIELGNPTPWLFGIALSHRGNVRAENQDRYALVPLPQDDAVLALVADGMGGHTGGSQAAELATETIQATLQKSEGQLYERLQDSFVHADEAIRSRAKSEVRLVGMGTTGVAAIFHRGHCTHLYTGDSRLYHFRDREEVYRTKDHSIVRYLVDEGLLTPEEARSHPMRSRLTSSLGGGMQEKRLLLEPRWREGEREHLQPAVLQLASQDLVLLCSDGLCGEVSNEDLLALVKVNFEEPQKLADECIRAALACGGRDNITVIVVKVGTLEETAHSSDTAPAPPA
jgi:serine/threonine protein phosphatase PrpC